MDNNNETVKKLITKFFSHPEPSLILLILILVVIFGIAAPVFLSVINLFVLTRQMSVLVVLSLGSSFVIMVGEIDLSFTSVSEFFAAVVVMLSYSFRLNWILLLLIGFGVSVFIALLNSFLINKFKIPSFLATLAFFIILPGASFWLTQGGYIPLYNQELLNIFGGEIFGFPVITIWMIIAIIIFYVVLHKTRFGTRLLLTGGNEYAARMEGIKTNVIKTFSFIISAIAASLAALLML